MRVHHLTSYLLLLRSRTISAAMPDSAPLSDLRVLDLSRGIAGAFCTKLFAQFSGDVITLEPLSGHPLRRNGPFAADRPHRETGAMWLYQRAGHPSATG